MDESRGDDNHCLSAQPWASCLSLHNSASGGGVGVGGRKKERKKGV
jgi:hypothetical protein